MKVLVTGAAGFICGYLVEELLGAGHEVVGLDNFSKYGRVTKSYDDNPRYRLVEGDAKDVVADDRARGRRRPGRRRRGDDRRHQLLPRVRVRPAGRERADPGRDVRCGDRRAQGRAGCSRIVVLSSSMVFESTTVFPTPEGAERTSPPPISTYGFQKLASEYFAHGAWEQYQLPYTILRPFNCVGIGERRAVRDTDIMSGNVKLALSHVVPDLVLKTLKGQDPLHILGDGSQVRHYTYGGDLARGIRLAMESDAAVNDDFNLSTAASTTVLELAEAIWTAVHGAREAVPLRLGPAVRARRPAARPRRAQGRRDVLGFEATTSLDDDARRGHPVDPRRARGGTVVTELSIVVPVFKEGEAVEPVLRALDAGDHDPARDPGRVRLRRGPDGPRHRPPARGAAGHPRPAQRPRPGRAQRDEGGDRGVDRRLRPDLDGATAPTSRRSSIPMVELARGGADVVSASRYMKGGHQVGGPLLKRLMSRTAGLTLHWFGGVADPRPDQQLQALLAPLPRRDHDRERGRVRAGPRADGQGHPRSPAHRRGPDDLARPDGRPEQLQAPQVAAALPALVLGRHARPVRAPEAALEVGNSSLLWSRPAKRRVCAPVVSDGRAGWCFGPQRDPVSEGYWRS